MPATGVYRVMPASMANFPASLMYSGVQKSGSPALKPMTSMPSCLSFLALASIARVTEGDIATTRSDSVSGISILPFMVRFRKKMLCGIISLLVLQIYAFFRFILVKNAIFAHANLQICLLGLSEIQNATWN